jgi:hypothetical protein
MSFATKEIADFLSPDEISVIDRMIIDNTAPWLNYADDGTLMSTYYEFDFYSPEFGAIYDIMWPRIQQHFGDIFIGQMHIFDSITPYHIHSDVESGVPNDTAWTFIIPLDTYASHTIVFNEGSKRKDPVLYAAENHPYDPCRIDHDTWQRYLGHIDPGIRPWLSIEAVFPWQRGHLFAADRWKFHTSDDYQANGVARKRALVAWTNTKPAAKNRVWYPRFDPAD